MTTTLAGVRRQLEEARVLLGESAQAAARGEHDPAYRAALRMRNLVFHAERGLAAARGRELPEMPVVGGKPGGLEDHAPVDAALVSALGVADDIAEMPAHLDALKPPLARYLGWLREEVARQMRAAGSKPVER